MPITKAKRKAKLNPLQQIVAIRKAAVNLKAARDQLRAAGSKNAADYVARAMKSVEGAERHANRMFGTFSQGGARV